MHAWKTPPGTLPDGQFSPGVFKAWVEGVRAECERTGHIEVALLVIGEVLIHTPPDANGFWMNEEVAEVLNGRDAEELRRGFCTGLVNERGVFWVDPTGAPEKEYAAKYHKQAEESEDRRYHRLASSMRDLADRYTRDADRVIAEHGSEGKTDVSTMNTPKEAK